MRKRSKAILAGGILAAIGVAGAMAKFQSDLAPMPPKEPFFVRWEKHLSTRKAAQRLAELGVLAHPGTFVIYASLRRRADGAREGTYQFHAGMTAEEILTSLHNPIRQKVRLPEGWWIARTAKILESKGVCKAREYIAFAAQPERFVDAVTFKLPANSLEGYLYPDTYNFPPLLGAEAVIRRQLHAFQNKVVGKVPQADLPKLLTEASLIELEVAADKERPLVASVIENRIKRKMALEIDATVLYGLQQWKVLVPGTVRKVKSPYNTYLHKGLPPGPIGSPSWASINAAAHPAKSNFLFYVARPSRTHFFTSTYPEHQAAVKRARAEWAIAKSRKT